MMARTRLPFDRVVLGGESYSIDEFKKLPLSHRVRHILMRDITFYRGELAVDTQMALARLRETEVRR